MDLSLARWELMCDAHVAGEVEVLMTQIPTVDELISDLMELRRGHGLFAEDAPRRAGAGVRRQCGIEPDDTEAVVRRKLLLRLGDVAAELPDYVRPVVEAALAIAPETRHRFLHQRMQWAAKEIDRDHPRTAQRRLETGLRLLAEQLLLTPVPTALPDREWHTVRLDAVLRMDLDPPVLTETRTVKALVDNLDELSAQLSVPRSESDRPPARVRATMAFGGEIVEDSVQTRTHATFVIRLPAPLMIGERHQYSVEFTGPPRESFSPLYVMEPLRRCDHFSVRVKFTADTAPQAIWRISGLPPRRVDEFLPSEGIIKLDSVGEAIATFDGLIQGLSYGIQWNP